MPTDAQNHKAPSERPWNNNGLREIDAGALSTIISYLPGILLEARHHYPERRPPWIEPVEGSLLLADISGFTRMSEQLAEAGREGAEWLTNIINHYFRNMLDIARGYGGDNLKFGGDALLVLFRGDNHALRAVTAARMMQQATQKFTTFRVGQYRIRLNMTVGVHSGVFWYAAAGLPERRMQHFVLGSEASRVAQTQAAATAGELIISESTRNMVSKLCLVEPCAKAYRVIRLSKQTFASQERKEGHALPPSLARELLAYLPPPIAQALEKGEPAKSIEGEHRKVSIVFINLLGVNELLEERGPGALLGELQRYLAVVVPLLERYGGFLSGNDIYTSGIKLIIIFGAPVTHEQDSANALRLALELNRELADMKLHLHHRIGINSGFVFAGNVGPDYRRQYTVMGDAVNLAARLMSSASASQIFLSRQVAGEAGQGFVVRELPPIQVKGKKAPVPICALDGERTLAPARPAERLGMLLGRQAEIDSFRRLCREAEQGHSRSVVISGEAGIGKSRLCLDFQEYLRSRGWTLHRGACYAHTSGKPFEPWIHILNSFFHIESEDATEVRTEKVLGTIKRLRSDYLEVASLFNSLLGLSIPAGDVVRSLDDEERRHRLFELISGLLEASAKGSATAILIEDLHWADSSSLQLVNHVGARAKNARFLMCLTHRPREEWPLNLPTEATVTFALGELSREAALQIIQAAFGRQELPEHVLEAILAKSRGNPLFLEEVARAMHGSGALEQILRAPSLRLAEEMASLEIPDRIQGLIMSRIDTLNAATKEVLRTAAVIGNTFDLPTLRPLLDLGPGDISLDTRVEELIRLDFINREEVPNYRFRHALIQEVAYNSLLFAQRRQLHHRIAANLEETHPGQLERYYEALVHHYAESRDDTKTRFYAYRAADKACRVFAHEEAIEYFRRGLETLRGKDSRLTHERSYFLERIGDCYEASGHHAEAARTFSRALRQWARASLPSLPPTAAPPVADDRQTPEMKESVLQHKIAAAYERNCDYDLALKHLEIARSQLPPRQPRQAAKIAVTRCLALFRKGQYEEAIRWGHLGLTLSRRTGDQQNLAYAYNILVLSLLDTRRIGRAIRYSKSALGLYNGLGDLSGQAEANNNLGVCFQCLGDQEQALHHFEVSLALCQRVGNFTNVAIAHNNVGEVLLVMDRRDEAIKHLQKVVETYEKEGSPIGCCGLALVNLARAYQRQEDYQAAFDCLERGTKLLQKAGARSFLAEAVLQRSELLLATSQVEAAMSTCRRALDDAQASGFKLVQARGLHILGRIDMTRGLLEQAKEHLQQSADLARRIKADYECGVALLSLARLYLSLRKDRKWGRRSQLALKRAVTIFRRVGAQADLAQALQMQADLGL
jgi:class 3 adenylate cyclase/tetratricopeptide (TPR) repeat protein